MKFLRMRGEIQARFERTYYLQCDVNSAFYLRSAGVAGWVPCTPLSRGTIIVKERRARVIHEAADAALDEGDDGSRGFL